MSEPILTTAPEDEIAGSGAVTGCRVDCAGGRSPELSLIWFSVSEPDEDEESSERSAGADLRLVVRLFGFLGLAAACLRLLLEADSSLTATNSATWSIVASLTPPRERVLGFFCDAGLMVRAAAAAS